MAIRSCNSARRALGLALALAPTSALAGAWTLPEGKGLWIQSFYGWGGQGTAAREDKLGAQSYLEYGLAERLTLFGQISAVRFALSPPQKDSYFGFDYAGAGLRRQLWANDAWTFSLEASAYVPGAHDANRPAQAGNTGPQADARALLGRSLTLFGAPAFAEAQAGYRLRSRGPPGEWRADLTLGIAWTPKAQVLAQVFNMVSQGAGASGFPAFESHKGQLSVVYALDERSSLQLGGFATLFRRGTNSEYGALVAVWRRF